MYVLSYIDFLGLLYLTKHSQAWSMPWMTLVVTSLMLLMVMPRKTERLHWLARLACRLHLSDIYVHVGGAYLCGDSLRFRHDKTGRRTDFQDDCSRLCQGQLRSRRDASVVGIQRGPKHLPKHFSGVPAPGSNAK